jgi:formamidopyrimidine-DNA glycosylase
MPELPEVETTRRSILSHIKGHKIKLLHIRQSKLRWPVPKALSKRAIDAFILDVKRRAKYLLLVTNHGTILIHLGMSGHLRILSKAHRPTKHDHIDLMLDNGKVLRYTDPRRFGAWLWAEGDVTTHVRLKDLGPEPLSKLFTANYLYHTTRNRKLTAKQLLMNNHIVVGVGNIYANEALFLAGIHPKRIAATLQLEDCQHLVIAVKDILNQAIKLGGTTLRNFLHGDNEGKPGYFKQKLWVYGRRGQNCKKCDTLLQESRLGQRSSFFCPMCQK